MINKAKSGAKYLRRWGLRGLVLLIFCFGKENGFASEKRISQMKIESGRKITGRGNSDEPLLCLRLEIVGHKPAVWKKLEMTWGGTATKEDVTRIKIYMTADSVRFDPGRVAEYRQLGKCRTKRGKIVCPLVGELRTGHHCLWVTCDVASGATEGRRIEPEIQALITSCEEVYPEKPSVKPSCEILLARKLLYAPGDYGSRNYRIPAIVTASDGSLVIATDKRKFNQADLPEDIDVVVNRSTDGGKNWSAPYTLAAGTGRYAGYGDAALVRTDDKGGLLCVFVGGPGFFESTADISNRTYVCRSEDNGSTWSLPRDITDQLFGAGCADTLRCKWAGSFCASGSGLLGNDGTIWLVAAVRENMERSLRGISNYVYYSHDKGDTWKVSSCVKAAWGNEAKIVELSDGTLLVSIRNQKKGPRYYSISTNKGKTWCAVREWSEMVEPGCNGDIIRYTSLKAGDDKNRLLHSVPNDSADRKNVTVFLSYDEGKTWPVKKTVCAGGSAYSSLCILQDGSIGIYTEENERGESDYSMYFTNFSLGWLTDGRDALPAGKFIGKH